MQVKELTVRRTVKVSLGNYENTDVDASVTMLLDTLDIADDVHAEAIRHVHGMIRSELVRLKKDPTHYGV